MSIIAFPRQDAVLRGFDSGDGSPVIVQHGLGGSEAQVSESLADLPGFRRLILECRGQGGSMPGSRRPFSIAMFADDLLAFCAARGVTRAVMGGISMGAAIALRLAVHHPERVRALILARPAWLCDAAPATLRPYAAVAAALRSGPPPEAKARFARSPTAGVLARVAPDNLASLLGFFDRPDPQVTADLLEQIAADGPGVTRAEVQALTVPALVIGHAVDHAHPLALARALADLIPGARFEQIPPKAGDRAAHVAAFRAAVIRFLHGLEIPTEFPP